MCHTGNNMMNLKHPDIKAISSKQQYICEQFKLLQKLATARQHSLVESMCRLKKKWVSFSKPLIYFLLF